MVTVKKRLAALLLLALSITLLGCGNSGNAQKNNIQVEGNRNDVQARNGGTQNANSSNNSAGTKVDTQVDAGLRR